MTLTAADFLAQVLPSGGHYVLAYKTGSKLRHETFSTIAALAVRAVELGSRCDVWYGIANFEKEVWVDQRGKTRTARQQENVYRIKIIPIDCDVGEGKDYSDKQAAVDALKKFCKDSGWPSPGFVNSSGNGIHTYWVLDRELTREEWQPLADAFKRMCELHGFKIDPSVTGDSARILRPPETFNFKNGERRPVTNVLATGKKTSTDRIRAILRPYLMASVPGGANVNDDLKVTYTGQKGPVSAQAIFQECPYMAWVKDTHGATQTEPEWMGVLHLLSFCDDGREFIHDVSDKHATYSQQATEEKFAQRYEVDRKRYGPTTCEKFDKHQKSRGATSLCATCPHNGSFKSPIKLGIAKSGGARETLYRLTDQGIIEHQFVVKNEDGSFETFWQQVIDFKVSNATLLLLEGSDGPDRDATRVEMTVAQKGSKPRRICVRPSDAGTVKDITAMLGDWGVVVEAEEAKHFGRWLMSFAKALQENKQTKRITRSFGWQPYNGERSFALHDTVFSPGVEHVGVVDAGPTLQQQYCATGKLARWQRTVQAMLEQKNGAIEAIIASSFAAPLVAMLNLPNNYVVSAYSPGTGTGKSTALRAAQSVWGDPQRGLQSVNDTPAAISQLLADLANLPVFWDEMRAGTQDNTLANFIFRVFQGRERLRMDWRNRTNTGGRTWQTLLVCASNKSLVDAMLRGSGDTAGIARVFEVEFGDTAKGLHINGKLLTGLQMQAEFDALSSNFGVAGQEYVKALVGDHDNSLKWAQGVRRKWSEVLDAQGNTKKIDRFHADLTGLILAAAFLANKYGILKFDTSHLASYLLDQLRGSREFHEAEAETLSPHECLADFMSAFAANTLTTNHMFSGPGRATQAIVVMQAADRKPVIVQEAELDNRIAIDVRAFRSWLNEHRLNRTTVLKGIKEAGYFVEVQKKYLGAGTDNKNVLRGDCLVLDKKLFDEHH